MPLIRFSRPRPRPKPQEPDPKQESSRKHKRKGGKSKRKKSKKSSSKDPDIEVNDWVVHTLGLSDSKLQDKDLDNISSLMGTYCNVKVDVKQVVEKHREEEIFKKKQLKEKKAREREERKAREREEKKREREERKREREERKRLAEERRLANGLPNSIAEDEEEDAEEDEEKDEDEDDYETIDNSTPTAFGEDEDLHENPHPPISVEVTVLVKQPGDQNSSSKTGAGSSSFQPMPGCSKDPDIPPPRPMRPKSRHRRFNPVPGLYDDLPPIRIPTPDLNPALPDLMNEPPRGVVLKPLKSEPLKPITPKNGRKAKVDSDVMELALIIYLAKKHKTTELKTLLKSAYK